MLYSHKAARKAHPDKGISKAKMATVNEVYKAKLLQGSGCCAGHGHTGDQKALFVPPVTLPFLS
jgi:hypothetical protein